MRKLTEAELRERRRMLNRAWDDGHWCGAHQPWIQHQPTKQSARYRAVSRIIKVAEEKERPKWENLDKDRR